MTTAPPAVLAALEAAATDWLRAPSTDTDWATELAAAVTNALDAAGWRVVPIHTNSRRPQTPAEAFTTRTRTPDDDNGAGHLEWTGYSAHGQPRYGLNGHMITGARLAWLVDRGREPVGQIRRTCGRDGCVAPKHLADRVERNRPRSAP